MTVTSIITCHQVLSLPLTVTAQVNRKDGVPATEILRVLLGEHDLTDHLPGPLKLRLARNCEDELLAPRCCVEV